MRTYEAVARAIYSRPWAVTQEALDVIVEILTSRMAGERPSEVEIRARLEAAAGTSGPRSGARQSGAVAVIPLYGVIAPRIGSMAEASGGTSVERFRGQFREAMANGAVSAILIDCDSPGGAVDGVPEMADEIRAARGQKPVVAVADTMMASGALWICSGAAEVWASPSSQVGSIGVRAAHQDISKALEMEGVKMTQVTAGKYKGEGSPWEPLSADALAAMQEMCDQFYGMFTQAVAKSRGVPVASVREGYGQGRVLTARDARAEGMVDGIGTFDEALARAQRLGSGAAPAGTNAAIIGDRDIVVTGLENFALVDRMNASAFMAGPIPSHHTDTSDSAWDGPANEARLPSKEAPLRASHAWVDSEGDPDAKASYRFIHHEVSEAGEVGPANEKACSSGIGIIHGGRGGTTIPESDKPGTESHLQAHLDDAMKADEGDMMGRAELELERARAEADAQRVLTR
jgi:signal peptide peptidase SppA